MSHRKFLYSGKDSEMAHVMVEFSAVRIRGTVHQDMLESLIAFSLCALKFEVHFAVLRLYRYIFFNT